MNTNELVFPTTLTTVSVEETEAFGALVASYLLQNENEPRYIALRGDLGVGKTAFIRGFASVATPGAAVRSPTYALVNEYRAANASLPLFHFDMYRISDEDDLYSIGYYDYLDRGICLVEWSENIPYALPDVYLTLSGVYAAQVAEEVGTLITGR